MSKRTISILVFAGAFLILAAAVATDARAATREFPATPGQKLVFDLQAGGSITITGWDESRISVDYQVGGRDAANTQVAFKETSAGLKISSDYADRVGSHSSDIDFDIKVPRQFDLELDSMGGSLEIRGVDGTFSGTTMGGPLTLHDVRGEARLKTMGGEIRLTDSELDGSLETMGGAVLFENVVGNVKGSSMGGNVRYKNVVSRSGDLASPARVGGSDVTADSVQISTMGGAIEIDEAPEGAALHTMGGTIRVTDASRFVDAKTMGGDIVIDAVDGWVKATTMGGDIEVTVIGTGGEVTLTSMSGDITLTVPSGFSMDLDLEIAYTRNSDQDYRILTDLGLQQTETSEWDRKSGTPRRYIRTSGSVHGGQNKVKIRTVNGNIRIQ